MLNDSYLGFLFIYCPFLEPEEDNEKVKSSIKSSDKNVREKEDNRCVYLLTIDCMSGKRSGAVVAEDETLLHAEPATTSVDADLPILFSHYLLFVCIVWPLQSLTGPLRTSSIHWPYFYSDINGKEYNEPESKILDFFKVYVCNRLE